GLRRGRASPPALDGPPTGPGPVGDGLLRLQRQLQRVAGEMVGPQRRGSLEVFAPASGRLPGPAEDQVQVDVETDRPRRHNRGRDVRRLVGAAEGAEADRRERLGTEREARDPECGPGLQARTIESRGIRLNARLERSKVERLAESSSEALDL